MAKPNEVLPREDQIANFIQMDWTGPVYMLNLLKFRDRAQYEDAAGETPCTGAEAYARYGAAVTPILERFGGKPVFRGEPQAIIIGDEAEDWDEVLIVRYPDKQTFLDFTSDEDYLSHAHHRTAALERAALLPMKVDE